MRAILIFANILLACIIAQGAIQWLNEPSVNAEVATSVNKERRSSAPQAKNVQQQQQQMEEYQKYLEQYLQQQNGQQYTQTWPWDSYSFELPW